MNDVFLSDDAKVDIIKLMKPAHERERDNLTNYLITLSAKLITVELSTGCDIQALN